MTLEEKSAVFGLLSWLNGGRCSDCEMFQAAPCDIEFLHHEECGCLKSINKVLAMLGEELWEGHSYADPKGEMLRLMEERCRREERRNRGDDP